MVGCVDPDDLSARLFKVRITKNLAIYHDISIIQEIGEIWTAPSDVCLSRECVANNNVVETRNVKANTNTPCDPAPTCNADERLITVPAGVSPADECCPYYECFKGCWEVRTEGNGDVTYIPEMIQKIN